MAEIQGSIGIQPPTPLPEAGQGPWCDPNMDRWWVVADTPGEAMSIVGAMDCDIFPIYFAWKAIIEPVVIRWADDYNADEDCIVEDEYHDEDKNVQAWRITVENR